MSGSDEAVSADQTVAHAPPGRYVWEGARENPNNPNNGRFLRVWGPINTPIRPQQDWGPKPQYLPLRKSNVFNDVRFLPAECWLFVGVSGNKVSRGKADT